jgi:hypothetical protein
MALTDCPECNRTVSNQALSCPHCGFPLAQSLQPDLGKILCAGRWLAQSGTLVDAMLTAAFSPNHTFQGQTRHDPNRVTGIQLVGDADFQGRWQVAGPQLFLDFPLSLAGGRSQTQIAIQFTQISANALSGVDGFRRGWEWQNVGAALAAMEEHQRKQEELAVMLRNLADMRHKMLEGVAERLRGEEEAANRQAGKPGRKRSKKSAGT